MKNKIIFKAAVLAVTFLLMSIAGAKAWTSMETRAIPPFVVGNAATEASQVGCAYGFKIEPWPTGTPPYIVNVDGVGTITITDFSNTHFKWTSTFPIYAVIVKAGDEVNIFYYDGGATGDTEFLYTPLGPQGQHQAISHVTFCWNVPDQVIPEVPLGTVVATVSMIAAFGAYFGLRKRVSTPL